MKNYKKKASILVLLILFLTVNLQAQQTVYQTLYTDATFTKTINTGLPVGVIDGQHGVSASGASSYTIPIKLPPGTNGFIPQISVSYNSQGSNGVLGMGWNILGVSTLSVTNRTLYYDNKTAPVELNIANNPTGNPYILDGVRLIPYNTNLYHLETQTFTTIKSQNPTIYGAEYFTSYSKDGSIAEFGNSIDSKLMSEDGLYPIIWGINKLSDRNGNYIEFKYKKDKRNFLIDEINYTGRTSSSLLPYNKIKFNYTERKDSNRVYISNSSIGNNFILENIQIYTEGSTPVKTYKFQYAFDDLHSVLQEVIEMGSDNTSLNSTIFKYGESTQTTISPPINCGGKWNSDLTDNFSGDFDGDGKTDILCVKKDATDISGIKHHVQFFTSNESSLSNAPLGYLSFPLTLPFGSTVVEKQLIPNMTGISPSDFNGDGKDDLLVANTSVISSAAGKVNDVKIYYAKVDGSTAYKVTFTSISKNLTTPNGYTFDRYSSPYTNFMHVGDFDGDGTSDYILVLNSTSPPAGYKSTQILISYPSRNIYNRLVTQSFYLSGGTTVNDASYLITSNDIKIIDFDGDGKSDILLTKDNYCRIFTFNEDATNANTSIKVLYSSGSGVTVGYPTKFHKIYLGDFNGDKKTDLLTINTSNLAEIAYSTGTIFSKKTFTFTTPITTGTLLIRDFNGDEKTDICHSTAVSNTQRKVDIYYPISNNIFKTETSTYPVNATGVTNYTNQDFLIDPSLSMDSDGDGNYELTVTPIVGQSLITCYKLPQVNHKFRLNKIIDGFKRKIEFSYQPLSVGQPFYKKDVIHWQEPTGTPINKVRTMQNSIYVVSSVMTPDMLSGNDITNYTYEGAFLNTTGKGFLGFATTISSNVLNNTKIETKNIVNTQFCITYPKIITSYALNNNNVLSQQTITTSVIDAGNKKFYTQTDAINETNSLTGATLLESYTYDAYRNILTSTKNINNEEITNESYTGYFDIAFYGVPYLPTSSTLTKSRTGASSAYTVTRNYTYDSYWNLKFEDLYDGSTLKISKKHFRNSFGNIINERNIDVLNNIVQNTFFDYDSKGRFVIKKTNNVGQFELFTYDPKWGKILSITGIDNLITQFEYDGFGKQTKTIKPDGAIVTNSFAWDVQNGNGTSATSADNSLYYSLISHSCSPDIKTWYDAYENVRRTDKQGYNNTWISQVTSYDARGNIKTTTTPFYSGGTPDVTTITYDDYNRVKQSSNSIGTSSASYTNSGGVQTTTTTLPSGQSKVISVDASGKTISSTDGSGTLNYTYDAKGNQTKVTYGGNILTEYTYDWNGNQTSLTDKNSGLHIYTYNAFGWLTYQKDNKGQEWTIVYDGLGRIQTRTGPEGITSYTYVPSGNGINQIKKITGFSGINDEYTYDSYGKIKTNKKTVSGVEYLTTYNYDACGNESSITYSSGLTINRFYDANGYLAFVKNGNNTQTIFTANNVNAYNQYTNYTLGNNKTTNITYDQYGKPKLYFTTGIQNLEFTYNDQTGNITKRNDYIKNKEENFAYDNLDRLINMQVTGLSAKTVGYENNGNINQKTDAGTYTYDADKINQVTNIKTTITSATVSENSDIKQLIQYIEYTPFNQPSAIYEGISQINYEYGSNYQRVRSVYNEYGVDKNSRTYLGDLEIDKDLLTNAERQIHYIKGGNGLVCIIVRENNIDKYYYVYSDNLGSILTLTNETGTVVAEQNFDAWGRYRDPVNWDYTGYVPPSMGGLGNAFTWLNRGYTGHEHLPQFDLINMNGRMYDPIIGRMLSPDNYVEDPLSPQGYNRYSYVVNNPLKYNDPSGQIAPLIIFAAAAIIGGGINVATHWSSIYSNGSFHAGAFFKAFGIGAGVGLIGAVSGGAAAGLVTMGGIGGAALSGFVGGVAGSLASTPFLSVANNMAFGDPLYGVREYVIGAAIGGVLGGTLGVVGFKIQQLRLARATIKPNTTTPSPSVNESTNPSPVKTDIEIIEPKDAVPLDNCIPDQEFQDTKALMNIAKQAEDQVGGTGRLAGIQKHKLATSLVEKELNTSGQWNIEQRWINPETGEIGQPDLFNSATKTIYDFKFGENVFKYQSPSFQNQMIKYMEFYGLNKVVIIGGKGNAFTFFRTP